MKTSVYCGTFESEVHWREPDLAKLPSLPDATPAGAIEGMDEMLFAFCENNDRLLTRRSMNDCHVQYLRESGFDFVRNEFDLIGDEADERGSDLRQPTATIFELMGQPGVSSKLTEFLPYQARLEPFAVLPGASEMARRFGLQSDFPSQEVIRYVNTKSYSLQVRDRLGITNVGTVVHDVPSLVESGLKLLQVGPFLIKDDYGVSGKGNQLIDSERALQRIGRYLSEQTSKGKHARFVLEPYLRKTSDFSCQFCVGTDGAVTIISVQQLVNNGMAFGASCTASAGLLQMLERRQYFELMRSIGAQLYLDGYNGDVCVDSMTLENDDLAPLVEINARKSMSLIKHAFDRRVNGVGKEVSIMHLNVIRPRDVEFATLLGQLRELHVLFEPESGIGIIPLTSGTLFGPSRREAPAQQRGRLYIAVVAADTEQRTRLLSDYRRALEGAGLHANN